ncbi:MAG: hypothetical protein HQL86_01040 [Magnetococcales bacterium]|nr:hypothetical protein [Magnetococcales bacterium]
MSVPSRLLVVLDPNATQERLIQTAIRLGSRHERTRYFFVSLFDPLHASNGVEVDAKDGHDPLAMFRALLDSQGCDWSNSRIAVATPHPEVASLASAWHATLILTDQDTARELRQSWFPWLRPTTALPCPLLVVQSVDRAPIIPWRAWLQRLRLPWFSRDVAPISGPFSRS